MTIWEVVGWIIVAPFAAASAVAVIVLVAVGVWVVGEMILHAIGRRP